MGTRNASDDSKAIGASSQRGQRGKLRLASLPGVEQQNTAQRIYNSHPASREAHGRTWWRKDQRSPSNTNCSSQAPPKR